jgi:hypothetical protein
MKGPEFNICDHYNTHFNNLADNEGSLNHYFIFHHKFFIIHTSTIWQKIKGP